MRRGLESELDISQAVPGEWLVSTDTRYIRMCFAPGIVLRMATYESFEEDMEEIQKILDECQTIEEAVSKIYEEIKDVAVDVERIESAAESAFQSEQNALSSANNASDFAYISSEKANIAIDKAEEAENNAKISEEKALEATNAAGVATSKAEEAKQNANNAENMADISKSYAVGDTGVRLGEDIDNSKYYSEIAKTEADRAKSEADKAESVVNIGVATVEKAGIVKPDGTTITVDENGTIHSVGGGTADYNSLENKPSINGVELFGNKTTSDLGINAESVGADAVGSASAALSDAKEYTNAKIDDLVNGAPSTLDTLKEISEALEESGEAVEAINQAIGNKLDKAGDSKDNTVTFTQESERSNITSNEKHSTIFGKIAKWFSDLKTVAFSGSYNDLSNKPNIPTKVSELQNDSGYATDKELKKTTELVAINKQTLGYGKKNLLKNTAVTHTHNGVTFTVNNDGSITANGTVTATPASITISGDIGLEKGKSYILSGSPNNSNCFVKLSTTIDGNAGAPYKEVSSARDCLFTYDGTKINDVSVLVRNVGTTIDNLTFYPMIRSADIEDGTYEPYVDDVDTRLDKIDNSILNTLEEISANTDPNMIAGALALKEINGNINRDFYGTNGYSQAFDLIPNNDVTAPLSRLGSCYISNEEEVTTYHAPETGYAFAFGKNVTRYAIIFIGASKVWYRRYPIGWKEL